MSIGSVPEDVIVALTEREAEIVHVEKNLGPTYGRFWRMFIAADASVERFLIRDCDFRLNWREKAAVDEWLASGRSFHLMRDSIHHRSRMLGGMWGGIGGIIKDITTLIDSWGRYSAAGDCDLFVSQVIHPIIAKDYICHDSWVHFADARPFPKHALLEGTPFVGAIVQLENENMDSWRRLGEINNDAVQSMTEIDALRSQLEALRSQQHRTSATDLELDYRELKAAGRRELKTMLIRLLWSGLIKLARPAIMTLLEQNRGLQEKILNLEQRSRQMEQAADKEARSVEQEAKHHMRAV